MGRRTAFALLLVLMAARVRADGPPELGGLWSCVHPRPSWGAVFVQLYPLAETTLYGGLACPAYDVSIWKEGPSGLRKLRDGLFGDRLRAVLVIRDGGYALAWLSEGGDEPRVDDIVSFVPGESLELGARLSYAGPARFPPARLSGSPGLAGVYAYSHSATGSVFVRFSDTGSGDCEVSVVREVPGLGWATSSEGLFGGSLPDDSFTRVRFAIEGGEPWLVWTNPRKPGHVRKDRVTCLYPGGDIGLGQSGREGIYIERSVLLRRDGPGARFGRPRDFLGLGGLYGYRASGSDRTEAVLLSEAGLSADGLPAYSLERVARVGGSLASLGPGVGPGDVFGRLVLVEEEGLCLLRFESTSGGCVEELAVSDLGADGGFGLVSPHEPGGGTVVARFSRIDESDVPAAPASASASSATPAGAVAPTTASATVASLAAGMEARFPFIVDMRAEPAWSATELAAVSAVLELAPAELLLMPELTLSKGRASPGGALVSVSRSRRLLRLCPAFMAADGDGRARALLGALAGFWYRGLPEADREEWEALSGWEGSLFEAPTAGNVDEDGYASPEGMRSQADDFAGFAVECMLPPPCKSPWSLAAARLPDKRRFVVERFSSIAGLSAEAAALARDACRAWIDADEVERVELLVTTPTDSSVASIAGHTLLLLKRKGDFRDGRDSVVLGFVGETALDQANGVSGLRYAYRGLSGWYRSAVSEETLESLVLRANLVENRDVLRFEMRLSRGEIERLVERLWVVSRTFTYRYRFFSVNCASMLLDLMDVSLEGFDGAASRRPVMAPMFALSRFAQSGRVAGFVYPDYPSLGKKARSATRANAALRGLVVAALPEGRRREAEAAFDQAESRGRGAVAPDPLFREPVLVTAAGGRAEAYGRIAALCASAVAEGGTDAALLALRYLYNAFDRELFLAVPEDIVDSWSDADPIPGNASRDFLEKRVFRVRARQENSPEVDALRRAISSLRLLVDDRSPEAEVYALASRVEAERAASAAIARRGAAFTHGYFPALARVGCAWTGAGAAFAAGFETSVYRGDMGDGSLCALKPDMALGVLSASCGLGLPVSGEPFLSAGLALFDIDKILVPDTADYSGFLSPGFGLTLLSGRVIVSDGGAAGLLAATDGPATVIEARFLLNLAEGDGFARFVNLGLGAVYLVEADGRGFAHGAAVPVSLVAKLRLPGRDDNALRVSALWRPSFALSRGFPASAAPGPTLSVRAEIGLGPGTNARLVAGAELGEGAGCFVGLRW